MKNREAAVSFILVTMLIDMLGIGMIIPVWPELVKLLAGGSESHGAHILGYMIAVFAAMQFVFSPILGTLSDQYGRRPILLLSLMGTAADYLMMAFAPTLALLFVGRVISGITSANITAANAYIADVTPPEERAKRFGMVGAVFGIGFVFGPLMGGFLGHYGPRVPFQVAALLAGLNFLYGLIVLPESHQQENRRSFSWDRANPFGSLLALRNFPSVLDFAAALFCFNFAFQALQAIWVLYTQYRFNWDTRQVGFSLMIVGVVVAISQAGLTGWAVKQFGERRVLILSLVVSVLVQFLYGMATKGWMMYAILTLGIISSMSGPIIQALVSKQVGADEQGAVQGALASLTSVTAVISPIAATFLFGYFISDKAPVKVPGISFFMGSFLMALGLVLVMHALHAIDHRAAQGTAMELEPIADPGQ
jgi:DHA1 family tetracycline resistance protein-like MFS transporter